MLPGAPALAAGSAEPAGHRRAAPAGTAAAADHAPVGTGAAAAVVHHRQPGAHLVRPAEHDARAALAPHRRARFGASTPSSPRETKDRTRLVLNLDKLVPYDAHVDGNNVDRHVGQRLGRRSDCGRDCRRDRPRDGCRRRLERAARAARHRLPARRRRRRPRDRQAVRPAHPCQPAPGGQPDRRRLHRRRPCRRTWCAASTRPTSARRSSSFDVTRAGNGARIAISANGDFEQLAYQSDDQYVVEVAPRRKTERRAG